MLEIEQRYRAADFAAVRAAVAAAGGSVLETRTEADHYFNAPDRDFAKTDEAFRVRRVGETSTLTYKGPKRAGAVRVRTEIEVPVAPGPAAFADLERMLVCLGYRPVGIVRKRRELFAVVSGGFDLTVCFDDLGGVGKFVEVEAIADEARAAAAVAAIHATAARLGLTEVETRSYLRMTLATGGGT